MLGSDRQRSMHPSSFCMMYLVVLCLLAPLWAGSQVVINEVSGDGRVELVNVGTDTVDISEYWLYNFPSLLRLDNATVLCDTVLLPPGHIFAVDSFDINPSDGELALFTGTSFNNALFLADYIEWGRSGHFNADLAYEREIWSRGDFIFPWASDASIEYDGSGDGSGDWIDDGGSSICMPNIIDLATCGVRPSELFTGNSLVACIDGFDDLISAVAISGRGDSSAYVITDAANVILNANVQWPVDFESLPLGSYYIRHLNWVGDLTGLTQGGLLRDLQGCVLSSNILTVVRKPANGGLVLTIDGDLQLSACGEGLEVEMDNRTASPELDYYYILTTDTDVVLASQDASISNVVVIDDPSPGIVHIYGLSGDNLNPVPPGTPISVLDGQPCRSLSTNFVRIQKRADVTAAGQIVVMDSIASYCASDLIPDLAVAVVGAERGDEQRWVVTDITGTIRSISENGPIVIDSLGIGTWLIYRLSYDDSVEGLFVGDSIDDLGGCFDLSDPITRSIEQPLAGAIATSDGDDRVTLCAGSARVEVVSVGQAPSIPYYYIVATAADSILLVEPVIAPRQVLDLSSMPAGDCVVYGWSQTGVLQPQPGMLLSDLPDTDCSSLSDLSLVVAKSPNPYTAGRIATLSATTICIDSSLVDLVEAFVTDQVADQSQWVFTGPQDTILAIAQVPPFDFNGTPAGRYSIYHLSHGPDLSGLAVGSTLQELSGCIALSNEIVVTRDVVDAGALLSPDSTAVSISCVGGLFVELSHTTTNKFFPYNYIVVNLPGTIARILDPADGPVFDLSSLGVGNYRIYGWSHTGLDPLQAGDPVLFLTDDDCQQLTEDFITIDVLPNVSDGGEISTGDPTTICLDNNPDLLDIELSGQQGLVRINYVITDEDFNILSIPQEDPPFDMDDGLQGTVYIYNIAHNGAIIGLEPGNNLADVRGCFSTSNPIVIDKVLPDAGSVSTSLGESRVEFCAGVITLEMMHTDIIAGLNYAYLVTSQDGTITHAFDEALGDVISFQSDSQGLCRVYGWSYDGAMVNVVGMHITELDTLECSATSSDFVEVIKLGSFTEGGVLTASIDDFLCADGIPDPIEVSLSGAIASNQSWVITDENGVIISLPFAPPFNLDPAGRGIYFIYNISYEDGLQGLSVLNPLSDIRGCFDLSNVLQVTYISAEAGTISTLADTEICLGAGGEVIEFETSGGIGQQAVWIVTNAGGMIEQFTNTGRIDFSAMGAGLSTVRRLSYIGSIQGLQIGATIDDIVACYDLSNSIVVNRTIAQAGSISLAGGQTEDAYCAGEVSVMVNHSMPNAGQMYQVVVTDGDNMILEVIADPSQAIDLSAAPPGVCRIFGWSSDGSVQALPGDNVFTLESGCSDITNTFVSINRQAVDGGSVVSTSGPAPVICLDGIPDPIQLFNTTTATALDYTFLVVDLNGVVVDILPGNQVDLEGSGISVSRIYGYSHNAANSPTLGATITGLGIPTCGDVSANFITVTKQAAAGGTIISDQGDQVLLCIDQESDPILFTPNTAATSLEYSYVITDEMGIIVSINESRLIDFNTMGVGTCRVYGWSHDPATIGVVGADLGSLDQACGDLSANFIEIQKVDTGLPCPTSTVGTVASYDVLVYPNPAQDRVAIKGIKGGDPQVDLRDMMGRQYPVSVEPVGDLYMVPLDRVKAGAYILVITMADQQIVRTVVVVD